MHPEFAGIIDDAVELVTAFPESQGAVLSNSTMLHKVLVNKIEDNILKLVPYQDSAYPAVERPNSPAFTFARLLEQLYRFNGNLIIKPCS